MKISDGRKRISLTDAKRIVLESAHETGEEERRFSDALYRVLSRDVISTMDNPPFDRAMMDGYAVIARDTDGASSTTPVGLKLVGAVAIGDYPTITLEAGEAVNIMTGAPIPKGADSVLRVESSRKQGESVEVLESVTPGKDISKRGEDVKAGDVLLKKGRVLKPHDLGVLAATGNLTVWVQRQPKVMVVSTGSELVEPGKDLSPGSIYDINTYTLSPLVSEVGGQPITREIIRDDEKELENLLRSDWDVLILSGATSVGEKDFIPEVIKEHGKVLLHGVNIRPGSPAGFGIVKGKPVFMLPGFPVSCIATFEHFVAPFIQKMLGKDIAPRHKAVTGTLEKAVKSPKGRVDFVRVKVQEKEKNLIVSPITAKGSSLITTLSKSDGYLLIDEEIESIEAGEQVKVYLY
jgi:molybdenum cofactor synthesis domain-containing protein